MSRHVRATRGKSTTVFECKGQAAASTQFVAHFTRRRQHYDGH